MTTAHEPYDVHIGGGTLSVECRCGWTTPYCKTLHDAADEFQNHEERP